MLGVGRITQSDTIYPTAIATGSDGNLWLAEDDNTNGVTSRHIARMTISGAFTDFTLPTLSQYDYLQHLIAGPDGNLWFFLDTD
jgi:streptogramin lyase